VQQSADAATIAHSAAMKPRRGNGIGLIGYPSRPPLARDESGAKYAKRFARGAFVRVEPSQTICRRSTLSGLARTVRPGPNGRERDVDVLIVGAGPVGLVLANMLGAYGLRVAVIEQMTALIDYPRGVGMDDECLRAMQHIELVDAVLPHTTPNHWMRFFTKRGRCFASIEPQTDEFGWPRRNAFIQPLVDGVIAAGLTRFPNVELRFGCAFGSLEEESSRVRVAVLEADGVSQWSAQYVVGCDGGRSAVRKALDIPFEGKTESTRWVVLDVTNDPIGKPGVSLYCDPSRPYVSIALPHGIRRFELMLFDDEALGDVVSDGLLRDMLAKLVPVGRPLEVIRARIYTHSARLAKRFRVGRVLLAGDAAHLMPVWQGQGYNSGIRDAANLGWKLAAVCAGISGDALLDTYETERREHARAMIALSEAAGKIVSPTNALLAALRDVLTLLLTVLPALKRYFLEMRFKPMPRYRLGALYYAGGFSRRSPVGKMFIQPRVDTAVSPGVRLDDVIGPRFAVIAWGVNIHSGRSERARAILERLDAKLICAVPPAQLLYEHARYAANITVVGDAQGRLKDWFDRHAESVVVLRPDRFVGAACLPMDLDANLEALAAALAMEDRIPAQTV
jgi:3-(3-hydroxy-phenyl)propionate hydroxylase